MAEGVRKSPTRTALLGAAYGPKLSVSQQNGFGSAIILGIDRFQAGIYALLSTRTRTVQSQICRPNGQRKLRKHNNRRTFHLEVISWGEMPPPSEAFVIRTCAETIMHAPRPSLAGKVTLSSSVQKAACKPKCGGLRSSL